MKLDSSISAVVTGAASGLGEATARALAAQGVKVAVFDRDAEKGEKVGRQRGQFDPGLRDELTALFRQRPRDHWCALLEGTDGCFAPVLSMGEAPRHPHIAARGTLVEEEGMIQPAPAPRFREV